MEKFDTYRYIFAPRPEFKINPDSLMKYDNNEYAAQAKLNGSSTELYLGKNNKYMTRHNSEIKTFKISDIEINDVLKSNNGYRLLCGEYMNKSKKDKFGKVFNHKYIIFDILVNDGMYLLGSTIKDRIELLQSIYNMVDYDDYLYKLSDNIFMVKSFDKNFSAVYNSITKIDMYEGFVLKQKNGVLGRGTTEKNNMQHFLKCRKPTKNYLY